MNRSNDVRPQNKQLHQEPARTQAVMNTVGEYVMYKNRTICRICDISEQNFGGEARMYYTLETLGTNSSRIYLPVDSPIKLRHVLDRSEIMDAIECAAAECTEAMLHTANTPTERAERERSFAAVLESGDRVAILRMIAVIAHRRKELAAVKKKLCAAEERAYTQGVKLIGDEFSFVLGIPEKEVAEFIAEKFENTERS